jgi:hypothetical protein
MTEKHLLNAIEHMEFHNLPTEVLENMVNSLDFIIDNDQFPGQLQEAAFCRLAELKEYIVVKTKAEEELQHQKNMQEAIYRQWTRMLNKEIDDDDNLDVPSNESEELIRLMIRSEEEGTLRFQFRGVIWEWNHNTNSWDFHQAD